jgi:3'-5' exoribonuclease
VERVWTSSLFEGLEVNAPFQVRSRQLRTHRSRSGNYLTLVLGDRVGEVQAVAWDDADRFYQFARDGEIVFVRGRCQLYNGDIQIVVDHLSQATASDYDLADFLPSSPRPAATMAREFRGEVNSVRHRGLRALLDQIFDRERFAEFALAPAAQQIHHAYLGGLLEHTLEVARLCHAELALHPEMDADLLIAGALLHDVGKTREFSTGTGFEQTDEGGLLGHIAIADALIVQHAARIPELPAELLLRLRHMLLSHHGRHEWQSPQQPKTLEAAALHLADYTSAQLAIFATATQQVERPSNWTPYQRLLDRRLYVAPRLPLAYLAAVREPEEAPYDAGDPGAPPLELTTPSPPG